jgi:polysaccharide export outer membrane protein
MDIMNMNKKMTRVLVKLLMAFGILSGLAMAQDQVAAATPKDSGTTTSPVAPATLDKGFQQRGSRYKLEAGDSFDLSFELNPEFNQTVIVQPDGFITLRGVGDIHVQGQTVPELTATLKTAYGKILNDPLISVILKDFEKPYFVADGQIGHPGKYDLRGDMTLTQAIAIAGGFLDSAKHSQVLLFRKASEGWYSAQIVNVKKMEQAGNLKEDPQLRPGDMLFVPKSKYAKIKPLIPGSNMGAFFPM